jgi:hypothetical protein
VSRRACNQIELKTIPNYCKLFNEFLPLGPPLTLDAERAGERKLTRLRSMRCQFTEYSLDFRRVSPGATPEIGAALRIPAPIHHTKR